MHLREEQLLPELDAWLSANWTRSRSRRPCASSRRPGPNPKPDEGAQQEIAECDAKLRQHRAALEAGADPVLNHQLRVRRALAEVRIKTPAARRRMTQEEITSFVTEVGGIMQALNEADPADKAEVYGRPGLTLTYHPSEKRVQAEARPASIMYVRECPRTNACQLRMLTISR